MHTIKKLKRTIVFILKLALFASLFGIFFGIFGINNPWLFNLSRTTGVTMVTFVVLGIALMQVYGGYAIGTQKSRPIVHSMALATIITDLVTHLQLSIMNTSEKNNDHFVYETPEPSPWSPRRSAASSPPPGRAWGTSSPRWTASASSMSWMKSSAMMTPMCWMSSPAMTRCSSMMCPSRSAST